MRVLPACLTDYLTHFSRQESSPSFSTTSTCPIVKNEAFLESLQRGQCGVAKIWDPTSVEFKIFPLSPPFPTGKFPLIFDYFYLSDCKE